LDDPLIHRDVKEHPDAAEHHQQRRAAVGDERQRDARERREPEHGREVDCRLPADERRDPRREPLPERIAALERDLEPDPGEDREPADQHGRADQPELLPDDREDHVRVRLGEEVDFLDPLPEPLAGDPARAQPDDRLHVLEPGALGVLPRVEEAQQARAPVRLHVDRGGARRERERRRERVEAERDPRDEEDPGDHQRERDRGPEVGRDDDQRAEERHDDADRLEQLAEVLRHRPTREHRAHPDAHRELRELGRLHADRAEHEPAVCAVDRRRNDEHRRAEGEGGHEEDGREGP
jgi:hypothetical protein